MAIIIPEGYAQVVLTFNSPNLDGGVAATVLGFGGDLGDNPTSLEDYAIIVALAWEEFMSPLQDGSYTLVQTDVIGPTSAASYPSSIGGETVDALAPPNTAVLVNKLTARRGRRGRGRIFLPGFAYDGTVDERGALLGSIRTDIQTAVDGFFAAVTDPTVVGVDHVVLQGETQPRKDGTPGSPPISPPPVVTSVSVQSLVASQRRRLRR